MPRALPLLLLMMVATPAFARDRLCLDDGWRFHLGDPARVDPKPFDYPELRDLAKASADDFDQDARLSAGRADPVATNLGGDLPPVQGSYDDAQWQPVSLPHDWVVDLPFVHKAEQDKDKFEGTESHGYKDIGPGHNNIGWYRRSFDLPAADRGQSLSIQFDGVYRNSVVWLNGHCLGRHADGYTGFDYDISTVANYGGKNELVVRVDASRPEGWFYEGAGIYRHVWLTVCNPVHVVPGSVAVTFTPGAKPTAPADLHIQYQIRNDSTGPAQLKVASRALSPSQKETDFVTAALTPVLLQAATTVPIDHHISLDQPVLWSTDQPNVYRVELIVDGIGVKYDAVTVSTGFRTIKFDPNKGFLLNGHHVEIRGTCNHQDMAGVGSALPDSLQVYRLQQLKKFGCNAIRTSHNPPTPELLDACDRLGILVMDETRKPGDTPELLNNLRDLVRRDRNHPSVILWSIANEEGGIQGDDKIGVPVATAMKKAIRELDDRPVTAAMNGGWGRGFSRVIDVQGFNYAANFNLDKYHHDHPTLPLIGSENGSTVSTRGVYANDPAAGYVSAYDVNAPSWATLAESWVATYRARPYMAGGFVWTGFDYRGEPTPYSWPCINSHFGLLDTCGFFKDNAYYYQSIWTTAPMVHLLPPLELARQRRPADRRLGLFQRRRGRTDPQR